MYQADLVLNNKKFWAIKRKETSIEITTRDGDGPCHNHQEDFPTIGTAKAAAEHKIAQQIQAGYQHADPESVIGDADRFASTLSCWAEFPYWFSGFDEIDCPDGGDKTLYDQRADSGHYHWCHDSWETHLKEPGKNPRPVAVSTETLARRFWWMCWLYSDWTHRFGDPLDQFGSEAAMNIAFNKEQSQLSKDPQLCLMWLMQFGLLFDARYEDCRAIALRTANRYLANAVAYFDRMQRGEIQVVIESSYKKIPANFFDIRHSFALDRLELDTEGLLRAYRLNDGYRLMRSANRLIKAAAEEDTAAQILKHIADKPTLHFADHYLITQLDPSPGNQSSSALPFLSGFARHIEEYDKESYATIQAILEKVAPLVRDAKARKHYSHIAKTICDQQRYPELMALLVNAENPSDISMLPLPVEMALEDLAIVDNADQAQLCLAKLSKPHLLRLAAELQDSTAASKLKTICLALTLNKDFDASTVARFIAACGLQQRAYRDIMGFGDQEFDSLVSSFGSSGDPLWRYTSIIEALCQLPRAKQDYDLDYLFLPIAHSTIACSSYDCWLSDPLDHIEDAENPHYTTLVLRLFSGVDPAFQGINPQPRLGENHLRYALRDTVGLLLESSPPEAVTEAALQLLKNIRHYQAEEALTTQIKRVKAYKPSNKPEVAAIYSALKESLSNSRNTELPLDEIFSPEIAQQLKDLQTQAQQLSGLSEKNFQRAVKVAGFFRRLTKR